MGAEGVEGELKGLHNRDGTAAKPGQGKGYSGGSREHPRDAAQSFDGCYTQTGLRFLRVIRGKGLFRSPLYRRWRGVFAFIKSWQRFIAIHYKGFTGLGCDLRLPQARAARLGFRMAE